MAAPEPRPSPGPAPAALLLPPDRWGGPAVAATVVGLGAVTVAAMVVDHAASPMPSSHLTGLPLAVALFTLVWLLELAGWRLPRLAFAAAVVLPNVWLTAIGHTGTNFLFLMLLVAWIVLTGTRAQGLATLGLCLATVGLGALRELALDGRVTPTAWVSWTVGILALWAMARLLVDQQRLVAALRAAQAQLVREAADNMRLRLEAEERTRQVEALSAQARQAAVLEERQRLARELHDAVTQTLFSASLIADVLPRLWRTDPDDAVAQLEELRQLTRGALAEMRALLFELRPGVLAETPLGDLVRQLAVAFTGRARVPIDVVVERNGVLAPEVHATFYRLAQEALNNVAKHAEAERVRIRLRCADDGVELEVADDGRGFDPAAVPAGHLGLGIMRERAEAIGAEISVESAPGRGTRMRAAWTTPVPVGAVGRA